MKSSYRRSRRSKFSFPPVVVGALLLSGAILPCLHAASSSWTGLGADGSFTNNANWNNNAPGSTMADNQDTATFNVNTNNKAVTLSGSLRYIKSFAFGADATNFTLGGTGTFGLTSGGSISLASGVVNTQTFTLGLALRPGAYTFNNDSTTATAVLKIMGSVRSSTSGAGSTLTLQGANTGANEVGGALVNGSTPLSLVKAGTGSWTLSGNNTYTGTTTVNGGVLSLTNAAGSVSGNGGSVTVNTGGTLAVGGAAAITGGAGSTLNLAGGTLRDINSGLTTSKAISLTGGTESAVDTNGFNATLSGAVTGAGDLDKNGLGTLTLANLATTGSLFINAGSVVSSGTSNSVTLLRAMGGNTVGLTVNANDTLTVNGPADITSVNAVRVTNGTTLNVTNNGQINVTIGGLRVGDGTLNLNGGTLDTDRVADDGTGVRYAYLRVGGGAGNTGTVNQSLGGTVKIGGAFILGLDSGTGVYHLNDTSVLTTGNVWSAPHVYIGLNQSAPQTGTNGTLFVSDGSQFLLNAHSYLDVGSTLDASVAGGAGTITQNGADSHVTFGGDYAGFGSQGAGGTGTYNLQAGALDLATGTVLFGATAGATGVLNQSGGTLTAETNVGVGTAGTGTYNLSGGTATFSNGLTVGATGVVLQTGGAANLAGGTLSLGITTTAGYEVNGGTLNVGGANQTAAVAINGSRLRVGNGAGSNGTLNLFDGSSITLSIVNGGSPTFSIGRAGGTGVFNMTGGTVNALAVSGSSYSSLFIGNGSTGTVNQSGGTVTGGAVTLVADGGVGAYNLSGSALFQSPDGGSDPGSHVYVGLNEDASTNGVTTGTINVTGNATFTMRSQSYLDVGSNLGDSATTGGAGTITQNGAGSHVTFGGDFAAFGSQGAGGTGTYNLQNGALDFATGTVSFGDAAGATGVLSQSGGTLTAETGVIVGNAGTGAYNLSNGAATFSNGLSVGAASGSAGTVTQTGGTLTIGGGTLALGQTNSAYHLNAGTLRVGGVNGINGAGTLNLGGGTLLVLDSALTTGVATTLAAGTYSTVNTNGLGATWNGTITGPAGGLIKSGAGDFNLASAGNTIGTAYVTAGSVTQNTTASGVAYGALQVGEGAGSTATYNLSAGAFSTTAGTPPAIVGGSASALLIGDFGGTGTFTQTGGAATINGSMNVGNQGGTGTYNLGGGTLNLASTDGLYSLGRSNRATAGTGTFNLSGTGAITMNGDSFVVGDRESSGAQGVGTVNQTGGTFTVTGRYLYLGGYGANNAYNLTGGTLQIGGNSLQGLFAGQGANTSGSYSFNLGGGTIQVLGSDLATSVNANLTANKYSTVNTNGLNATWNGVVTGATGGLIKTGAGTFNLASAGNTVGSLLVTGGTVAQGTGSGLTTSELAVGTGAGNTASYTLGGGTLTFPNATPPPLVGGSAPSLRVGDFGGTGTFTQTGGTANVNGSLNVGNQGGTGTYNLGGGTLNLDYGLYSLGRTTNATNSAGTVNLSGGQLNVLGSVVGSNFIVGDRDAGGTGTGVGTVNQSGGAFTVAPQAQLFLSGYGVGNSYNLTGGTLQVGGNGLQGNFNGGTGTYAFNLGGGTIQVVNSDLATSVNPTLTAATSSTVDTNGFNATFGGTIDGGGALVKIGAGTLTLPTANTYSGGTTVNAGSLLVSNPAGSATGGGSVTINPGGTLLGTGAIDAGGNSVTIKGTLSPGAGVGSNGTISVTAGALTLTSTSTLAFDLTGNPSAKDLVVLGGGSLVLDGGTLALNLGSGFDYADTYQLFTGAGNATISSIGGFGTVTGYDGSMYAPTFTYSGGDYDLSFTPVPEPATVLGGLLLVAAAGWTLRRHRHA